MKNFPTSKAKTGYGLLQDAKRHILTEPEVVNMGFVAGRSQITSCGTVGCLAGWCCFLTLGKERTLSTRTDRRGAYSRITFAELLMGRKQDVFAEDLEFSLALDRLFDAGHSDSVIEFRPGTKPYARAVARRIDRFCKRWGSRLRAAKLQPILEL